MDKRSRGWCFTINNYTPQDVVQVKALAEFSRYILAAYEVGTQGTPHIQGYVYFDNTKTLHVMTKRLPRAHFTAARGDSEANRFYIDIPETELVIKHGDPPAPGEKRGLKSPKVPATIEECNTISKRRFFQETQLKPRKNKTIVFWLFGPSGTRKTTLAYNLAGGADSALPINPSKFLPGLYSGQPVVMDEFRGFSAEFTTRLMLQMMDEHPCIMEIKGSACHFSSSIMVITSIHHPFKYLERLTWEDSELKTELFRRIDFLFRLEPQNVYILKEKTVLKLPLAQICRDSIDAAVQYEADEVTAKVQEDLLLLSLKPPGKVSSSSAEL